MIDKPQGCTNGHCWLRIEPLVGQHTNGGCNCLRDVPVPLRLAIESKIMSQREEIDRLKAENDDLRTVEWRCKFKAEQAKNADMQAEIARQRVELDSKRSALRRLRFELADATKAGTPYWSERDAMNGLIVDNQAKTDEIDRLREAIHEFLKQENNNANPTPAERLEQTERLAAAAWTGNGGDG